MKPERFVGRLRNITLAATIAVMPGAATAELTAPYVVAGQTLPTKGAMPEQEVFNFKQNERKQAPKKLQKLR